MDPRTKDALEKSDALSEVLVKALIGYEQPEIMASLTAITGGVIGMHALSRKDLDRQIKLAEAAIETQAKNAFDQMRANYDA